MRSIKEILILYCENFNCANPYQFVSRMWNGINYIPRVLVCYDLALKW